MAKSAAERNAEAAAAREAKKRADAMRGFERIREEGKTKMEASPIPSSKPLAPAPEPIPRRESAPERKDPREGTIRGRNRILNEISNYADGGKVGMCSPRSFPKKGK